MNRTTASDVAAYILQQKGSMTAMKLQKLVYYCQAWSLVWDDEPMFADEIQAWANGPVVPNLYYQHRGMYKLDPGVFKGADHGALGAIQTETVDAVLGYYGDRGSNYLSELSHREDPWKNARKGVPPGERGSAEISHESMSEYYGALKWLEKD